MSVFFHAFCEDCGKDVNACRVCVKTRAKLFSDKCKDCEENYCCHYAEQHYHEKEPEVKALYLCEGCEESRYQASAVVCSYFRWAADSSQPLSPTNVYRVPRFRKIDEGPMDDVSRAEEALAAYDEEMKFSGNEEEALKIYSSFYNRGSPDPKKNKKWALREGFVSMQEILAGRHVTGEQFFNALKYADEPWEEDDSYVGNNPKTMSKQQLQRAIEETEEDLKHFFLRRRGVPGHEMTKEDENYYFALNEWHQSLWSEMGSRG